ncbi:hypothetical protein ACE0DR_12470 [Azotobacter sp. CWF10]
MQKMPLDVRQLTRRARLAEDDLHVAAGFGHAEDVQGALEGKGHHAVALLMDQLLPPLRRGRRAGQGRHGEAGTQADD